MQVIHAASGKVICYKLKMATSFTDRLRGLMFITKMQDMDGLLLKPCNSIHNFFVKFPLDVVFLSSKLEVVKIIREFKPWQISGLYFKASQTLEIPAGKLPEEVRVGDFLEIKHV